MSSGRTNIVLSIAIGLLLLGASSVAKADQAYMATGGGAFGTIDLGTGVFTQLGLTNVPVVGLALVGTTLYADGQGTGNNRGQLYSVNPATGALMSIGSPTGIDFTAFGSYGGTLYALDHTSANANLYSINSSTGAATLIGPTNTGQPLAGYWALSTNSTALYFSVNSNLYTLNTSTGQATVVGGLGGGIQVGAIVEVGGVLYAGQDSPAPPLKIVTLSESTGAATVLSNVTNSPGSNASYIYGLAPTIQTQSSAKSFPHFASAAGWQTTFTLVNTGTAAATANLNFYGDDGEAASLPLSFPQTGATSTASSVSQNLAAGSSLIVVVQDQGTPTVGSAVLTATGNVNGFAIFRYDPTGQEAVVPLEAVNAASYVLVFDNSGNLATGLAIANLAAQPANVHVVIRDDTGAQIGTGSISLAAHGHQSFMLTDASKGGWPVTAKVRGTIEFDTPSGGQIAPLGLRVATIPGGGATITTIPVMVP